MRNLNKILAVALIFVVALTAVVGLNYALGPFNQNATVIESGSVIYTIDGDIWSGTDIFWGDVEPDGIYMKTMNVTNNQNTAVTPVLIVELPVDWLETWTLNNTLIDPFTSEAGTLTLTVPSDATPGQVSFTSTIMP